MTQALSLDSLLDTLAGLIAAKITAAQSTNPGPSSRLLDVPEAAAYLGRTESAIRQLIHKRTLPVIKIDRNVRIDVRDLDRIIEDARV